jgi:ribosome-binding protein aMBF1 (putative translation factor)
MTPDQSHSAARSADDENRTEQAKHVVEDYAQAIRELIRKLRRKYN